MKVLMTVLLLLSVLLGNSQEMVSSDYNDKVIWNRLDSLSGDRDVMSNSKRIITSMQGVKLIEVQMNTERGYRRCGCVPKQHGYYIEKYRTGTLKKVGRFYCDKMVGTWTYYYPNGQLMKMETLRMPYIDYNGNASARTNHQLPFYEDLTYILCREGPYFEFFENGQIKIEGNYEIREVLTNEQIKIDPDTYETLLVSLESKHWVPKSIKIGVWSRYDELGNVLESKVYNIEKSRSLEIAQKTTIFEIIKIY